MGNVLVQSPAKSFCPIHYPHMSMLSCMFSGSRCCDRNTGSSSMVASFIIYLQLKQAFLMTSQHA
jgi:hypothetical protein